MTISIQHTTLSQILANIGLGACAHSEPMSCRKELGESPRAILRRTLSTDGKPNESRPSTHRYGDAKSLRVIGTGTCGTVFELQNSDIAYKKGRDAKAMRNDYDLTKAAYNSYLSFYQSLQNTFTDVTVPRVPKPYVYISPRNSVWWEANIEKFSKSHRKSICKRPRKKKQKEHAAFTIDRIPAIPVAAGNALIKTFFTRSARKQAYKNTNNRDCLIRPYLGSLASDGSRTGGIRDTLRNFELHLDELSNLGINVEHLATEMAVGLAIVHWAAEINGMDIEFVLGSPWLFEESSVQSVFRRAGRLTQLWMLDFDKAAPIQLDEHGVQEMVTAVAGNDPYFPRPSLDTELWAVFSEAYLGAAAAILDVKKAAEAVRALPKLFLEKWEDNARERDDWEENIEDYIVFED